MEDNEEMTMRGKVAQPEANVDSYSVSGYESDTESPSDDDELRDEHVEDDSFDDWEGGDEEEEEEEEEEDTQCLLTNELMPKPSLALARDKEVFDFDLVRIRKQFGVGFYETIQLINFIRKKVANNVSPFDSLSFPTRSELDAHHQSLKGRDTIPTFLKSKQWIDEENLIPVIPNDPLLRAFSDGADDSGDESHSVDNCTKDEEDIKRLLERKQEVYNQVKEASGIDLIALSAFENQHKRK